MSIVNGEKMCGNCEYWNGSRKVSSVKTKAETTGDGMGICTCPKGANKGHKLQAIAVKNCPYLTRWGQLK